MPDTEIILNLPGINEDLKRENCLLIILSALKGERKSIKVHHFPTYIVIIVYKRNKLE
jgi:hypothetical protein